MMIALLNIRFNIRYIYKASGIIQSPLRTGPPAIFDSAHKPQSTNQLILRNMTQRSCANLPPHPTPPPLSIHHLLSQDLRIHYRAIALHKLSKDRNNTPTLPLCNIMQRFSNHPLIRASLCLFWPINYGLAMTGENIVYRRKWPALA